MALNDFRKGRDTGIMSAEPAAGGVGALTAFIDQGSEFTGKLSFKDTVRIDGRFEGEIASENTLIVGETGHVQASIRSATVIVSGHVQGDVQASAQVTLHKTAVVNGNIVTQRLVVEDGAELNGQVQMGAGQAARDRESGAQSRESGAQKTPSKSEKPTSGSTPSA
jgi:cytoskeletal protein CcmA (bactofilin family)